MSDTRASLGYGKLAQNYPFNLLQKHITSKVLESDIDSNGDATIRITDEAGATKHILYITGYINLANDVKQSSGGKNLVGDVRQSAAMLLDCLMMVALENNLSDTLVRLSLARYMELRGLKDRKESREQVQRDLEALKRVVFRYEQKENGNWLEIQPYGGTSGYSRKDGIIFRFNQDFFDGFRNKGRFKFMFIPLAVLNGNIKTFKWKYWLGRKLAEHKRMNMNKRNADIISVKTLLSACPRYPTPEDFVGFHLDRDIITPFENNMDALGPDISWHFQGNRPENYYDFIRSKIVLTWNDYPIQ